MLVDQIKQRMFAAMKAQRTVEKEILRVALGEIQTAASRSGEAASDELVLGILKKLVKSDEESLAAVEDSEQRRVLEEELAVLRSLLPASASPEQIQALLEPVVEEIRAAKSDGQATGIAMKHLKQSDAPADGRDVALVVRQLRS